MHFGRVALLFVLIATSVPLGACGSGSTSRDGGTRTVGTLPVGGGERCVALPIQTGAPPGWAMAPTVPPPPMPYVLSRSGHAAAFLFVSPPRVRLPRDAANKVLWVVAPAAPKQVALHIVASREGRGGARRFTADGEGRVFRSRLRFPYPGCWRLQLAWGAHRAVVNLRVRAA